MILDKIKLYTKNAKKHPDKQLEAIAKILLEVGWQQPIVVDKDYEIIVGHGRWLAYQKYKDSWDIDKPWIVNDAGETIQERIKRKSLTNEQVKTYRLADNKLNESDWDMDLVIEELKGLDEDYIELTGFDKDLIIEPDEKDDEVPDVPEEPIAKLGEIYQLGNHRIMCGDATKIEDVEKLMDGKKADMVFTDPPYGIDYKDLKGNFDKIKGDEKLDNIEELLKEVLVNNCPMYICCNWKSYSAFEWIMKIGNKEPKSCIVWDKETPIQHLDKFYKRHEFILYYGLFGGQKTLDGDVWRIKRETRKDHPTSKPVELIVKAINYTIMENQLVQDLFLGSGSTLIACEKTNRICYGMELDPKYIDVIIKRWEDYTGNKAKKL